MKFRHIISGFTLIELLITITIMSVIFLAGYANYRQFARRQDISGVSRMLRGDLRLAQQFALSGKKPEDLCPQLDGYRVTVDTSNLEYTVAPVCLGFDQDVVKTVKFPSSVSSVAVSPAGVDSVLFKVLGQGTDLEENFYITAYQPTTGSFQTIMVTPSGEITTDSQAITPPPSVETIAPVPTPTPFRSIECQGFCERSEWCKVGLSCISNICINVVCPGDLDCVCGGGQIN